MAARGDAHSSRTSSAAAATRRGTAAPSRGAAPADGARLIVEPRVHVESHLVLWQVRGTTQLDLSGQRRTLRAGHACFIRADAEHALDVGVGAIVIPYFLRLALPVERLATGATVAVDEGLHDELLGLTQQRLGELLDTGRDGELRVVQRMIAAARSHGEPPFPTSTEAALVAHLIAREPERACPMADLARQAYVSLRTVERQFTAETGLTPRQWRAHHRLALASQLIAGGTPPHLVGPQVGYSDDSAFRRAFKAKFGMTPRGAHLAAHRRLTS